MVEKTPETKKEEENNKSSKKLGFSSPRLELKKTIGGGTVRQSFSHGRTKSVSVEVKKVRSYKAYDTSKEAQINNSNNKDMGLSEEETEARLKAINNSIKKKESILEKQIEEINKEPNKVSEEN
jgi:translation initiation factor IF-2